MGTLAVLGSKLGTHDTHNTGIYGRYMHMCTQDIQHILHVLFGVPSVCVAHCTNYAEDFGSHVLLHFLVIFRFYNWCWHWRCYMRSHTGSGCCGGCGRMEDWKEKVMKTLSQALKSTPIKLFREVTTLRYFKQQKRICNDL